MYGELTVFEKETKISCEFFDVGCNSPTIVNHNTPYHMIYAQAIRKVDDAPKRSEFDNYRPSVVMIILDSVSHSSAKRRLPKTMEFLKNHMNLTEFHGYAKVGLNSNPNGMSFLTGKMKETPYGTPSEDPGDDQSRALSIWNEYKKRGFVTFYSEDDPLWFLFGRHEYSPTDHFLGAWPEAYHRIGLRYLSELLKIYENNPLFALLWISMLSHEQINDLDDEFLLQFFQKNENLLEDSFLILMGDHGLRFNDFRATPVGRKEDNLPLFSIALPKKLRNKTDLVENIKRNSQILTNHFDLYVTLWDIMTTDCMDFSTQRVWSNFTPVVRGASLLRPVEVTRTCESLQHPPQYCPCKETSSDVTNEAMRQRLAENIVEEMNEMMPVKICEKIFLEEIHEVAELSSHVQSDSTTYRVMLSTVPNNGTYQIYLVHDKVNDTLLRMGLMDRINKYGNTSHCVYESELKLICLCKNGT